MQANKYKVRGRVKSLQTNVHKCMILKSKTKTIGQNLNLMILKVGGRVCERKGINWRLIYFLTKTYIVNIATILTRPSTS